MLTGELWYCEQKSAGQKLAGQKLTEIVVSQREREREKEKKKEREREGEEEGEREREKKKERERERQRQRQRQRQKESAQRINQRLDFHVMSVMGLSPVPCLPYRVTFMTNKAGERQTQTHGRHRDISRIISISQQFMHSC